MYIYHIYICGGGCNRICICIYTTNNIKCIIYMIYIKYKYDKYNMCNIYII